METGTLVLIFGTLTVSLLISFAMGAFVLAARPAKIS